MKKHILFGAGLCLGCLLLSGCSFGTSLKEYLPSSAPETPSVTQTPAERTYMDEITGTLVTFDGSTLVLSVGEVQYSFDVSLSTLETKLGMVAGDEINVIYEGQMDTEHPENVRALKIVDDIHKKSALEEQTVHGTIESITSNVLTLKSDDGQTIAWPITGSRQYYSSGLKVGAPVYLHYKGNLIPGAEGASPNANHLKVLRISDQETWNAADPSLSATFGKSQRFRGHITGFQNNIVKVRPNGSSSVLDVDLSSIPCWMDGGFARNTGIVLYYDGTFDGNSLNGISIVAASGDNFDKFKTRKITSSVYGVIVGSTADTISLQTNDGAFVTCTTLNVPDSSTGGLAIGSSVRVVFDPRASRGTNVYASLSIRDA